MEPKQPGEGVVCRNPVRMCSFITGVQGSCRRPHLGSMGSCLYRACLRALRPGSASRAFSRAAVYSPLFSPHGLCATPVCAGATRLVCPLLLLPAVPGWLGWLERLFLYHCPAELLHSTCVDGWPPLRSFRFFLLILPLLSIGRATSALVMGWS